MTDAKSRKAMLVVDLGFGDAGKGTITDHLCRVRRAHTVVRFNGGAQAAHNVVAPDGRHHTFAQFGAGTFVPGVRTHLDAHFVLNPLAMLVEAEHLAKKGVTDAFERTTVDERALVITPFHRAANRIRELARGDGRHGSCGMGIGETVGDSLDHPDDAVRAKDLRDPSALAAKFARIQERKCEDLRDDMRSLGMRDDTRVEIAYLADRTLARRVVERFAPFARATSIVNGDHLGDILRDDGCVVFEGAQGVLIDEWHGFHPYTTWSTCTFANALADLEAHGYDGAVTKLGVVRAYAVRHGPGPFVTEDDALSRRIPDDHNGMNDWQRAFRIGWFDEVLTRYAIECCGGVDALAVTCLDRLLDVPEWMSCGGYDGNAGITDGHMFVRSGGAVTRIVPGTVGDLGYQQALGERLGALRPVLRTTTAADHPFARACEHLQALASGCGVPVTLASFGPRSGDKRYGSFSP